MRECMNTITYVDNIFI